MRTLFYPVLYAGSLVGMGIEVMTMHPCVFWLDAVPCLSDSSLFEVDDDSDDGFSFGLTFPDDGDGVSTNKSDVPISLPEPARQRSRGSLGGSIAT